MYSPALITYTFYSDDVDRQERIKNFLSGRASSNLSEANILNFSRDISAFNYIFGGDSVSVPLCSQNDLDLAKTLLEEGKIQAFCAGKVDPEKKAKRYYCGTELAVALIFAEKLNVKIDSEELNQVVKDLCGQDPHKSKALISGFEGYDIFPKVEKIESDFDFIAGLKKKYKKKYGPQKNKFWPF